jgi:hypothetical protein
LARLSYSGSVDANIGVGPSCRLMREEVLLITFKTVCTRGSTNFNGKVCIQAEIGAEVPGPKWHTQSIRTN